MPRLARFTAALVCAVAAWAAADAERYLRNVRELASPQMKGRGAGTPELDQAARHIAGQFQAAGLKPLSGSSYFQPFTLTVGATLGSNNSLETRTGGRRASLRPGQDFLPLSFSGRGSVSGAVVFAGYGITAPEYHYDDYAGLEVQDKIVVALWHEPQEADEKSPLLGKTMTRHAEFFSKAINARHRGAVALLLVRDRAAHPDEEDRLLRFGSTKGPEDAGLPVVQVKAEIVDQWLAGAGQSLSALQSAIDQELKPRGIALPDSLRLSLSVEVERKLATANNVIGFLPGATEEHIVIGAHYDHLGLGEDNSLAPASAGQIHPGADDNASGAAGLIELGWLFASRAQALRRGIVFVAFAGEELGLLGSSHYVNRPVRPLDKTAAMINMDMIGRVRNSKLFIGGVGTGSTLKGVVEQALGQYPFQADFSPGGYDASDHTSFTARQVPVLFFFSGLHGDYHKPTDTWDKIDAPGTARVLNLIFDIADRLGQAAERPVFARVTEMRPPGAATGSTGGGYGAYFGSIPDFGHSENGVKFADVRDGSPAAKAGLKAGDIMIEFDGRPIKNLYDFTYALRGKSPGQQVEVRVLRENKPLSARVTLEQRR